MNRINKFNITSYFTTEIAENTEHSGFFFFHILIIMSILSSSLPVVSLFIYIPDHRIGDDIKEKRREWYPPL
jgi:hypothetical protein